MSRNNASVKSELQLGDDFDVSAMNANVHDTLVQIKSLFDDLKFAKTIQVKDFIFDVVYKQLGNLECSIGRFATVVDSLSAQLTSLAETRKREIAFHKWQTNMLQKIATEDAALAEQIYEDTKADRELDDRLHSDIAPLIVNELCSDCQIPEYEMKAYCYPTSQNYAFVKMSESSEHKLVGVEYGVGKLIRIDDEEEGIDANLCQVSADNRDSLSGNSLTQDSFSLSAHTTNELSELTDPDWCVEKNLPNALSLVPTDNLYGADNNPDLGVPVNDDCANDGFAGCPNMILEQFSRGDE